MAAGVRHVCTTCSFMVATLLLAMSIAAAEEPSPKPPKDYKTAKMDFKNTKGTSQQIEIKGPHFSAYVYMQLPYDTAYDKRVIFGAYVQTMAYSCPWPTACDGQKGGNEYDLIETGFVGFNDTWAKNDNMNCGECGGSKCWSWGPACKMPGKGCVSGDDKHCNMAMDKQSCPPDCTWSDAQRCISYCTQVVELDPRFQDNTRFSANSFLGGQTGKEHWYYKCGAGTRVENDQRAYSVITPDGQKYGNRWIKLDLKLDGTKAWYTWTFFQPGPVSNRDVQVAGIQTLMVQHHEWGTYNPSKRHVWVFSIWQYAFKTAKAKLDYAIPGGIRELHFAVSEDNGVWPTPAPAPVSAPEKLDSKNESTGVAKKAETGATPAWAKARDGAEKGNQSKDKAHDDSKHHDDKDLSTKFGLFPDLVTISHKSTIVGVIIALVALATFIATAIAAGRRTQDRWAFERRELLDRQ